MLQKKTLPPGIIEATRDAQGRVVLLAESAMVHVARRHPEMDGCELAILTAVETALARCRGKKTGREVLYAPNLGPAAWLVVVVAYDGLMGRIITAFGSKRGPRDGDLI